MTASVVGFIARVTLAGFADTTEPVLALFSPICYADLELTVSLFFAESNRFDQGSENPDQPDVGRFIRSDLPGGIRRRLVLRR